MIRAFIEISEDSENKALHFAKKIVSDFSDAVTLGFFPKTMLKQSLEINTMVSDKKMEVLFGEDLFAPESLRILWGMCEWGREYQDVSVKWIGCKQDEQPGYINVVEPYSLNTKKEINFTLILPESFAFGDELLLFLEFSDKLSPEDRQILERGLEVWESLLCGGFPMEGASPGESSIGATSGHFISPRTYQWSIEGIAADPACIDFLLNFFSEQASRIGLRSLEFEN